MNDQKQASLKPPEAPDIPRKFQLYRLQMIGIPLIMLIPILALLGFFGKNTNFVSEANDQLEMQVEYPARYRFKMISQASVSIRNVSGQPLSTVTVSFDRSYIDNFSTVSFTPDVNFITDAAYVVELIDMQPQESRVIMVELQAEKYWQHEGKISAAATGGTAVQVSLETLVFP